MPQSSLNLLEDSATGSQDMRQKGTGGNAHAAVKSKDNEPEQWADGNTSGTIAASGTFALGDLTQYGYPYASLTFTEAGGVNSFTCIWGISQGFLVFQIAGTTPDVDLTATNTNGDIFTDVPVQKLASINPVSGQTLGAGQFTLYRP